MRILLITAEAWNDYIYGNNVLTNWFDGFEAEFAQIYCTPVLPNNHVCNRYFQITDTQMVCSLITKERAGKCISKPTTEYDITQSETNAQRVGIYKLFKKFSLFAHSFVLIIRDAIWIFGRYNKRALRSFVEDFKPDIVFCPRMVNPQLIRLERLVSSMTDAPFVAFTADNEASLKCYSWSPLFWLRRIAIHHSFKNHVGLYRHYFMFSNDQAQEYHQQYGISTSCLYKCGSFSEKFEPKSVNKPIRIIYAGRLYCNRWRTLAAIGEALDRLNIEKEKMVLDVFSADALTRKQERMLNNFKHLHIHAPITSSQLTEEYKKADIALHVESFDKKFRMATRYSFSTKIIDLMDSSCAIIAICWDCHAGYQYLKNHDAALCVSDIDGILPLLKRISEQPLLIQEYAKKAWQCGVENHSKEEIQSQIRSTFEQVISNSIS